MSKNRAVRTIRLPLRKIAAAIPAVTLISGGIIMSASAAPSADPHVAPVAVSSPAIVIPDTALTMRGSEQNLVDPGPAHAPRTPLAGALGAGSLVPILPAGTAAGSSSMVTLDSSGIPVRALQVYRTAATLISTADPSCKLDWALLAAIGRVESDHARFGGNQLDSAGVARPGIIGLPLNGANGTALITDTDHGLLDRDTVYDRAVGPMQFIPSTWAFAGVDANGDGVKDPENMADSAAATGRYLCSGSADLSRPNDLRSAILRYNASDSYATMVTAIASAYRHGVTALPAVDLAPARASSVVSRTARLAQKPARPASGRPAPRATRASLNKPALPPVAPAPTSSIPATTQVPQPTTTTATPTTSTSTGTTPACVPTSTASTSTASTSTASTSTAAPTTTATPGGTATCVPDPCLPATTTTSTTSTTSPTSAASPTTPVTASACTTATATTTATTSATSTTAP